jgi:predicted TIM-barrel fold metal-dependent hydrolase
MPRFDVHQHLLPAPVLDVLRARREPPRLVSATLELREGSFPFDDRVHDLGQRIALLDREGIDVAIVSLAPTMETEAHAELRAAYHAGIQEVVAAADGRIRALAAGECLPGFAGACVSAGALVAGLGELPRELARADGVLFVHPGPPEPAPAGAPPWWASVANYTAQMQAAYLTWIARDAEHHPGVRVVFAILAGGAPFQLERIGSHGHDVRVAAHPTVHLDTASYGRRALELCLDAVGREQLVYGSDSPVIDPRPTREAVAELGEPLVSAICSENPARLFV